MRRRQFLQGSLASLFAAGPDFIATGLWPGARRAEAAPSADGDFQFIALNDTHFRDERCVPYFEQAVAQMKRAPEVDFYLHSGDLATDGRLIELAPMKHFLDWLDRPYYVTPGNHDVDVSDGSPRTYRQVFGEGAVNVWFVHKGWQFLGFDSTEGTKYEGVVIQPATLGWLRDTLSRLDRQKPLVLFTHIPLGSGVPMRAANAEAVLAMFLDFNLKAIFNGHFHGYTLRDFRNASVTTDRCLSFSRGNHDGTPEKGYFICRVHRGQLSREFVQFDFKV